MRIEIYKELVLSQKEVEFIYKWLQSATIFEEDAELYSNVMMYIEDFFKRYK